MRTTLMIRADGGLQTGLGHLVRCKALAQMLKDDYSITFFSHENPESFIAELSDSGFSCRMIETEEEFFNSLKENSIAVIDGYHFDTFY